jgi:MFS superfamily sulfate permease-like transporter
VDRRAEAPPAARTSGPQLTVQRGGASTERHPLGADLRAGVVVFLVAIPLCLGVALASGAPLFSGILTGVIGGLVVSRLSGSQLMVSGPAAGLTAIVLASITQLGSFQAFLVAVVLAGLMQLGLGALKAGIIGYFFPSSVIKGMLAAIGLILILKQFPYALGVTADVFESDRFAAVGGGNTLSVLWTALSAVEVGAALIAAASLVLLVAWDHPALRRAKRLAPAPLLVVAIGILAGLAFERLLPALALPAAALVSLPVLGEGQGILSLFTMPDWSTLTLPAVWKVAVTIALVASLETLLSLEATDKLDPLKRSSNANRELFAQGVGNTMAGLVGGLPMTGVIVRSAANIDAGARTWRAAFVHGLLLAVAVLAFPMLLNRIPLASLAAILIYTGFKLAHPRILRDALRVGPSHALPFVITVGAILVTDLLVGIVIGLTVGAFFVLLESYRHAYSYDLLESADGHRIRLTLAEEVTFVNKPRINDALQKVTEGSVVTVDGSRSRFIDYDVVEMLHEFRERAKQKGIRFEMVGIPELRLARAGH